MPDLSTPLKLPPFPAVEDMNCSFCQRIISKGDSFYQLSLYDNTWNVCTSCKIAGTVFFRSLPNVVAKYLKEGKVSEADWSMHDAHFIEYILGELSVSGLDKNTVEELNGAIEDFESGRFSNALRSIGVLGENLTDQLCSLKKLDEGQARLSWEDKLGRLQSLGESKLQQILPIVYSLKWIRNSVSHPSRISPSSMEVKLSMVSFLYCSKKLRELVKGDTATSSS